MGGVETEHRREVACFPITVLGSGLGPVPLGSTLDRGSLIAGLFTSTGQESQRQQVQMIHGNPGWELGPGELEFLPGLQCYFFPSPVNLKSLASQEETP